VTRASKPRVFLGLTEVSGYYAQLRKGFVELEIECVHIPIQSHRFAYDEARHLCWPARLSRVFVKRRIETPESDRLGRRLWLIPVIVSRLLLFFWALRHFDVFIMGGGSSFFRFLEFPILKFLGKKIIYVLHGTDARPAYLDGSFYETRHVPERSRTLEPPELDDAFVDSYVSTTRTRQRDVRWIEAYADVVICGPGFAQLLEKSFVNFATVGIPFTPPANMAVTEQKRSDRVRILHATSDMIVRGTKYTSRIIDELKAEGLPIDFVIMTGQPNARVLEELAQCDMVVDGQWADTPMAGFATEAAWMGKPVVMGGYYAKFVRRDMPAAAIPPTSFTLPEDMKETIRTLVTNESHRVEVGLRMKQFAHETWSAKEIASRFLRLTGDQPPADWVNDSFQNQYFLGGGISAARIVENVKAIIARHGLRGLCLDHNVHLRDELVRFADQGGLASGPQARP
jgi:hypothetical protein